MNLQEFLGIKYPMVQAPMAGVQGSELAIAVSNAGGLGSLPCALLGSEALRSELERLKAGTDKPFNVNFFAHNPPEPDAAREQAWRNTLAPYYREFGIDADSIPSGGGRTPFNDESAALVEEFRPAVVSFHFGLPTFGLVDRVKAAGAKIISTATTVEEAIWLEEHGADGIIAQGIEAGGHRGIFLTKDLTTQMSTLTLVPQIVSAVTCPVIAAGGIASAEGIRAVMNLGAAGAQLGTAFLLCPEATTKTIHREALKSPKARHTAVTNLFSGGPARGIVNRAIRELGPISTFTPEFPLAGTALAPLRASAEAIGRGDFSSLWSGQNASGCREVPAAEQVRFLTEGI